MLSLSRRTALLVAAQGICVANRVWANPQPAPESDSKRVFLNRANEQWMKEHEAALARAKEEEKRGQFSSLSPPQQLVPFRDWDYYYTKGRSASWTPNPGQSYRLVRVPSGFVTDLASIPQWAWSSGVRPEGAYAYAAIIHDYLYWMQDRTREEADEIFLFAMQDSKVEQALGTRIFNAVRLGGGSAWSSNAASKAKGEKRILRQFPPNFTTTWKEWKATPNVFL